MAIRKIVVVGAGPSGLLLALLLAQHGIDVEVLEAGESVDHRPRAMILGSTATDMLRRAGAMEIVAAEAQEMRSMTWRDIDGRVLQHESTDGCFVLPVDVLCQKLIGVLGGLSNTKVSMGHKVVRVEQDEDRAWVYVETTAGKRKIKADFVIGCDGASSGVRQALVQEDEFARDNGGIGDKVIVANVRYDMTKYEWSDMQWIADPDHWGMVASISQQDHLWRVVARVGHLAASETVEEVLCARIRNMLPGRPQEDQCEILNSCSFRPKEGSVESMREGRILLAGDAAHLCNPIGGYGLAEGFADAGALVDCLCSIHDGNADLSTLDRYSETRLQSFKNIIEPAARERIRWLSMGTKNGGVTSRTKACFADQTSRPAHL